MKRPVLIYSAILLLNCSPIEKDLFLSPDFVNLKGKESLTILKNSTTDTLRLKGEFFSDLPYAANSFEMTIPPNGIDTLKFNFTYPDFIHLSGADYFRIFNAPGKTLYGEIVNLTSKAINITFQGECADINNYYLSHRNQLG